MLVRRLWDALKKLNPLLPTEALEQAVEQLTKNRGALNPVEAGREIYRLLRDGVRVTVADEDDSQRTELARVIDWKNPGNNDFFLASQFWISGEMYKRRVDMLAFVNGIPLALFELKAVHRRLEHAYTRNISDYKDTIPQLFWYLDFIIVSNGTESRVRYRVAGVRPTTSNEPRHFGAARQECYDLAFAFRTVLAADDDRC